jgi:hypothetical protein
VNAAKYGSIGMPPNAVIDYMKCACGFEQAREIDPLTRVREAIVGAGTNDIVRKLNPPKRLTMYDGLGHWVYLLNGEIYSWGLRFTNIQSAMSRFGKYTKWKAVCKIVF